MPLVLAASTLRVITIARPEEVLPSIDAVKASGAEAVNFLATPLTFIPRAAVFERVSALRLPAIYQWPEMAEEGGLIAYGPRFTELWRQRARFVVKVLRGAMPADLPVEQPTKFDLVVNVRTAKELGLTIPVTFLLRADKVIE
jgi:putative tryptophan/tyrosine transport system substrate-binding protein